MQRQHPRAEGTLGRASRGEPGGPAGGPGVGTAVHRRQGWCWGPAGDRGRRAGRWCQAGEGSFRAQPLQLAHLPCGSEGGCMDVLQPLPPGGRPRLGLGVGVRGPASPVRTDTGGPAGGRGLRSRATGRAGAPPAGHPELGCRLLHPWGLSPQPGPQTRVLSEAPRPSQRGTVPGAATDAPPGGRSRSHTRSQALPVRGAARPQELLGPREKAASGRLRPQEGSLWGEPLGSW